MPGTHSVIVSPALWDKIYALAHHHRHPGVRTAFEDARAALERMDLTAYVGQDRVIKRLREVDRVDGRPEPLAGLPGVLLCFSVNALHAVVLAALFPELPPPRDTNAKIP